MKFLLIMQRLRTFINNRDGFIALLFSATLLFLLSFKIDIVNPNLTNFQWAALRTIIILVLILLWKKLKYLWKNRSVLWRILFRFWLIIFIFSIFVSIYTTHQYQIFLSYSVSWTWTTIFETVFLKKLCLNFHWIYLNFHWWFFFRFVMLRFICFLFYLPDAKNE